MKTIKIIDLYVRIAKGEDLPKKIEIGNNVFELNETSDIYYTGAYNDIPLSMEWDLNDEVKIIEEEKEIEKLTTIDEGITIKAPNNLAIMEKLNEVIDAVNELKNKED